MDKMTRAEFKRLIKPLVPSAVFSTGDSFTQMSPAYIDVTVPCADVPALEFACLSIGKRAVFVSVLPYGGDRSHRRVALYRGAA